jgi:hypothetical protein
MKFWKCPKCKRMFEKRGQPHSCAYYPVARHMKGKDCARKLYSRLKIAVRSSIGSFRVESLQCCIHFVATRTNYTFMCAYALRDGIKVHFTLPYEADIPGSRRARMSANRYLYELKIRSAEEMDGRFMGLLKEAYGMKKAVI